MAGDDDVALELTMALRKNEILRSENAILKEELDLFRGLYEQSKESVKVDEDNEQLAKQVHQKNALIEKLCDKLAVIQRGLVHERSIHSEMKCFLKQYQDQILAEATESLTAYVSQARANETRSRLKYNSLTSDYTAIVKEFDAHKAEMNKVVDEYCQFKSILVKQREQFEFEIDSSNKALQEMEESRVSDLNLFNLKLAESEAEMSAVRKQTIQLEEELTLKQIRIDNLEHENRSLRKQCEDIGTSEAANLESQALSREKDYVIKLKCDEIALLNNRVKDLQSSLSSTKESYEKLLSTNDSLQSDMQAILRRELLLRNELGSKGHDSHEIQLKLKSIQDKMTRIEREHDAELSLKMKEINSLQSTIDGLRKDESEGKKRITELEQSIAELTLLHEKAGASVQLKLDEYEKQLAKATQETVHLRGVERELQRKIEELRDDRDQFEKQAVKATSSQKQLNSKIDVLTKDKEKLVDELAQHQKLLKEIEHEKKMQVVQNADLNTLKQELNLRNEEIKGLKDTIRRECEERTHLLISISELKDQLNIQESVESSQSLPPIPGASLGNSRQTKLSKSVLTSGDHENDSQSVSRSLSASLSSSDGLVPLNGAASTAEDDPVTSMAWLNRLSSKSNNKSNKDKRRVSKPS